MKFPKVDLSGIHHAETILKLTKKQMLEHATGWVCDAIGLAVKDTKLETEGICLKRRIAEAIEPWGFVTTWRTNQKDFGGSDYDYRLAWIDHMLEQLK